MLALLPLATQSTDCRLEVRRGCHGEWRPPGLTPPPCRFQEPASDPVAEDVEVLWMFL